MRTPLRGSPQPNRLATAASLPIVSRELLRTVADEAPIMLWVLAPDGRSIFFNREWLAFTGRDLKQELGLGWLEGVHPHDRGACLERCRQALQARQPFAIEHRLRAADGRFRWVLGHGSPWVGHDGKLLGFVGSSADVTELKETQTQARSPQLAARLAAAREEERAALARELHDELGQTLTAIKLELGRATAVFRRERMQAQAVDRLQSLIGLAEIAIATVKRFATTVRPVGLDHRGLLAAMQWEATTFRARTGIRCQVRAESASTSLTLEQQAVVVRIFQEALTNVIRHAHASAVYVSLVERRGAFELRIRDNGCGISDAQRTHPRSIGLIGMSERAALVGGTLEIAGRPGRGTALVVRVRLPRRRTTRTILAGRRPPQRQKR